jgi:cystathionine gamma-lyase
MGCLDSIMKLFKSGDHIIVGANVYGGTFRLFDKLLGNFGLRFSWVDTRDPQRIADAMKPNTVAVMIETPTNPLMQLTDIAAAAQIAKKGGALLIVDNTFATPYFQNPLSSAPTSSGIRAPSTSTATRTSSAASRCSTTTTSPSAAVHPTRPAPCPGRWTAGSRCAAPRRSPCACASTTPTAASVADWLANEVGEKNVFYPGLASHPQHELAKRQMSRLRRHGLGGDGLQGACDKVVSRVKVFTLAESLGGVESLVCQPGRHDPRVHRAGPPARDRDHGRPDPVLVRGGGCGGPDRGLWSRRSRGCEDHES